MKKDEFKKFVQNNPNLINYVKNNEMTWQKFYELYDLYGENNDIWNPYLNNKDAVNNDATNITKTTLAGLTISDIFNFLKKVDLDSLQEGIGNVQRVLGLVQDFSKKDDKNIENNTYKPRPLYRHFED